jgi:hypothetical protein
MQERSKSMDEAQIRREARAEAFEEVWLLVDEFRKERAAEDYRLEAALLWNIGDRIKKRLAAAERATRAPKPTVRYTEAPEPETPPEGPPAAWFALSPSASAAYLHEAERRTKQSNAITDCVEDDGFTTEEECK